MIEFTRDAEALQQQRDCCRCHRDLSQSPNYIEGPNLLTGKLAKICYKCYDKDVNLQEWYWYRRIDKRHAC